MLKNFEFMDNVMSAHIDVLIKNKASAVEGDWHSVGSKKATKPVS